MRSYTLENIQRDKDQDSLYNIFSKTVVDQKINRLQNTVIEGEDGRLDKVSLRLYGSTNYVEELMIINNIINPFSIKVGDVIFYVESKNIEYLRQIEKSKEVSEKVANPKNKKGTRVDPTRQTGVPPTVRPIDFEQVIVDKKNNTIKLNTRLS